MYRLLSHCASLRMICKLRATGIIFESITVNKWHRSLKQLHETRYLICVVPPEEALVIMLAASYTELCFQKDFNQHKAVHLCTLLPAVVSERVQ